MVNLLKFKSNQEVRTLKYQVEHYNELGLLTSRRKGLAVMSAIAALIIFEVGAHGSVAVVAALAMLAMCYFIYIGRAWAMVTSGTILVVAALLVFVALGQLDFILALYVLAYWVYLWKAREVEIARAK